MLKRRIAAAVMVKDGIAVQSIGFQRYLPVGRREARHSERQPAVPFLRHSRAVQGCRLTFRGPPIRAASSLTIGKGGKAHTASITIPTRE